MLAVPPSAHAVVSLWLACRAAGGQFGARALPCGGGVGEQPAGLMRAFDLLDLFVKEGADGPAV